jgi:hypothetical protein
MAQTKEDYEDWAYRMWLEAEEANAGVLLNRAGRKAGVSARSLFSGTDKHAMKYASEELKRWWQEHPDKARMTLTAFRGDADAAYRSMRSVSDWG